MKTKRYGNLIFIPGKNGGRYPFCNSLFIDDEKKVIIDPGCGEEVLKNLRRKHGVDVIITTHYHEDHVSYNYLFPEAELYVHKYETECYTSLDRLLDFYGLKNTEFEQAWRNCVIDSFHYRERTPTHSFSDGSLFTFGETTMEVIHTPGHSIGHCCFYFPDEEIVYLGDIDLTSFGPWYGDRVSDIDQMIDSVHKLLSIPARTFISSHETGVIEGNIAKLAEQYLAVIDRRENALLNSLEKPRTLDEIINEWLIYKKPREPRWFYQFTEGALIRKHLERLMKNGTVHFHDGRYSR